MRTEMKRVAGWGLVAMWAVSLPLAAQKPKSTSIEITVEGVKGDTVYLANYLGDKMFYADTAVADAKGKVVFEGRREGEWGKYAVVLPGPKYFDFLGVNETIRLKTRLTDPARYMEVLESPENKLFYDYLFFLSGLREQAKPHEAILADSAAAPEAQAQARSVLEAMGKQVAAEQKRILQESSDMLFAKYLNLIVEPEIPPVPEMIANPEELQYRWYRNHYWDRVDFTDPRLVRDGSFHALLDRWWTRVLPQDPDTLIAEGNKLIARTVGNPDMFKYVVHYITFTSESSQIMCMDKVFYDMAERYYRTGKAVWLKPEQVQKVLDRAEDLSNSLCGNKVPNIILPDLNQQEWVSLYDVQAKYTLMVIWESTCGHCKKELPILEEIYREWKPRGLEIFAIGNDFEPEPWQKFVREKGLEDWIHVSDNPLINAQDSASKLIYAGITTLKSLNFRTTFDVYATPKLFLLDADKKLIAKQVGAEQMAEILARLEGLPPPPRRLNAGTKEEDH